MHGCTVGVSVDDLLHIDPREDDRSVLIIRASVMLYPDDELYRGLNEHVVSYCVSFDGNIVVDDPSMTFGSARWVHLRFHDECPDTKHICKFINDKPLTELWEEDEWQS